MSEQPAGDYAALVREAREHLDRIDGTLVPEFVKVPDGFYTGRLVLDEPIVVGFVPEGQSYPDQALASHVEPCRIPKYRTEVRWVPSDNGRGTAR